MRKKVKRAAASDRKRGSRSSERRASAPRASAPPRALHYKVVELSNVDEGALERAVNEWVPLGWAFDGVQFAMRESSKRPAMAFLFFTREGAVLTEVDEDFEVVAGPTPPSDDVERLNEGEFHTVGPPSHDAWARLRELAGDDGSEP